MIKLPKTAIWYYDTNREAAKISALSSEKIDKYEYLTGEEILLSYKKTIEKARLTYSLLRKSFKTQTKTIEVQGRKQVDAITNQNERVAALTNEDDHKENYNKIFEETFNKRFDKIK